MKSEWKVCSNMMGDQRMYGVYRLKDQDEVDHSGNRETAALWNPDRNQALDMAEWLNDREDDANEET